MSSISSLYMALSRPCGISNEKYFERPNEVKKAYKKHDTCKFEMNGEPKHPDYIDSGFKVNEL